MQRRIVPDVIGKQQLLEFSAGTTVREAARAMCERQVGAALITRDGVLEGIFTERDVLHRIVAAGRDPDSTRLRDVMTKNPDTIEPDEFAVEALRRMTTRGYRHLPVVEDGRLVGIVSRRDFLGEELAVLDDEIGHLQRF
jgi:CBS domain-containing protein